MSDTDRGFAMRVGVSCGELGAQIEITAVAPMASTDFEVDLVLDRMMRAAQRQRALSERSMVEQKIEELAAKLVDLRQQLAIKQEEREQAKRVREERRGEIRQRKNEEWNSGAAEWRARNKGGEFKPVGGQKQSLDRYDAALKQLDSSEQTSEAECLMASNQIRVEIQRTEPILEMFRVRLEECRVLIAGGTNNGADSRRDL
jgi:hypothetical protein